MQPFDELTRIRVGYNLLAQHNISLSFYSLKHPNNKHHKNCLAAISAGVADVTSQNLPFSNIYSSPNLTQAAPRLQYDASFISLFKNGAGVSKSPDLFDFVTEFPISILITVTVLMNILFLLSRASFAMNYALRPLNHRSKPGIIPYFSKLIWKIFASSLGNWQQFKWLVPFKLIIALITALIVCVRIICFLTMRTEQVVSAPPVKLDSVDQLLDCQVPFSYLTEYDYQIFRTSVDPKIRSIFSSGKKQVWGDIAKPHIGKNWLRQLMDQKQVYILPYPFSAVKFICQIATLNHIDFTGYGLTRVPLDSVPHPLAGYVVSKLFMKKNSKTGKLLQRSIRLSMEADIIASYEMQIIATRTKATTVFEDGRQCNLSQGRLTPVLFRPSFRNMHKLILISMIIMIVALLLFIAEVKRSRIIRAGSRKQVLVSRRR